MFRITIPLPDVAIATVGPTTQVTTTVTTQDKTEKMMVFVEFCVVPRSKAEMMEHLGLANANHFRKAYLKPLLDSGKLVMTIPDKPNGRNQKYVRVSKP